MTADRGRLTADGAAIHVTNDKGRMTEVEWLFNPCHSSFWLLSPCLPHSDRQRKQRFLPRLVRLWSWRIQEQAPGSGRQGPALARVRVDAQHERRLYRPDTTNINAPSTAALKISRVDDDGLAQITSLAGSHPSVDRGVACRRWMLVLFRFPALTVPQCGALPESRPVSPERMDKSAVVANARRWHWRQPPVQMSIGLCPAPG